MSYPALSPSKEDTYAAPYSADAPPATAVSVKTRPSVGLGVALVLATAGVVLGIVGASLGGAALAGLQNLWMEPKVFCGRAMPDGPGTGFYATGAVTLHDWDDEVSWQFVTRNTTIDELVVVDGEEGLVALHLCGGGNGLPACELDGLMVEGSLDIHESPYNDEEGAADTYAMIAEIVERPWLFELRAVDNALGTTLVMPLTSICSST